MADSREQRAGSREQKGSGKRGARRRKRKRAGSKEKRRKVTCSEIQAFILHP
jgi:hypothetical protein